MVFDSYLFKLCDPRQVTSPLWASLLSLQSGHEDLITEKAQDVLSFNR